MPANVSRALADLKRAFALLGRRWYVFGAQAVAAAGVPRFTADVDVTVEADPPELGRLLAALGEHGIVARQDEGLARFVAETRVIPAAHTASRLPIDIVLAGRGLEEEMLGRVRMRRVGRMSIPFVDTADLVALKLLAGRPKDLEDVRALLRARPDDLDVATARERISLLGALLEDPSLTEAFDEVVRDASEPAPRMRRPPPAPPQQEDARPRGKRSTAQKRRNGRR